MFKQRRFFQTLTEQSLELQGITNTLQNFNVIKGFGQKILRAQLQRLMTSTFINLCRQNNHCWRLLAPSLIQQR